MLVPVLLSACWAHFGGGCDLWLLQLRNFAEFSVPNAVGAPFRNLKAIFPAHWQLHKTSESERRDREQAHKNTTTRKMAYFFGGNIWDEIDQLHSQMRKLSGTDKGQQTGAGGRKQEGTIDWIPATDLIETGDDFRVVMDLPGVKKEDVVLDLREGVLTITGTKPDICPMCTKQPEPAAASTSSTPAPAPASAGMRALRLERATGKFHRSFSVPGGTDAAQIKATFEGGVLAVIIAKPKAVQPVRIDIK
jgi:HSP20 family protein